jgi:hypothetical protein
VNAGFGRIDRYPYLRSNRFLASFGNEIESNRKFTAWLDHLQNLDQSARRTEIANMSAAAIASMGNTAVREDLFKKVITCGDRLRASDFSDPENRLQLKQDVVVKDAYIPLRQAIGLYPLTSLFVSRGVRQWHEEARQRFGARSTTGNKAIRYASTATAEPAQARHIVRHTERDALGIPSYDHTQRRALFEAHAPQWQVDTTGQFDRIGSPFWSPEGHISVDTTMPVTYTHLSFTRYDQAILTQLNYIIWFPARPKSYAMDIYGGILDGLNYRVTLNTAGRPILYETMHNCGCYYKAYPTNHLRVRETIAYAEPPLIFSAPDLKQSSQTMVVAMQSRTHYVNHLYFLERRMQPASIPYTLVDYEALTRLARPDGGFRSMFDRTGIVPGTQRLERYLLWPTGVLSPGAMRQWGTHAVAFVGRRHFDDPFYLEEMFTFAN